MEADVMQISQIQTELTRIWDSLEGSNKTRASLFNLILFTYKNERVSYIRTLAQNVIERIPSRLIFITVDRQSTKNSLQASVSVVTGAKGESDVVCDLIEFEADETSQERIPFAILPHLLPDLPIYVLWSENPSLENPILHQIERLATRMIYDSETTDHLSSFSMALLKSYKTFGCDIADLNWARTENWRELLSSTFYSEERISQLKRIKSLQIVYNAYETKFFCHTKIQALYLQGWLASQLNWKPQSMTDHQLQYENVIATLDSEIHPDLPPGAVISIDLKTFRDEHFLFYRTKEHPHQVNMVISTLEKCDIPSKFIFTKSQANLSLVNEICHNGTSEHYLKLLLSLSQ